MVSIARFLPKEDKFHRLLGELSQVTRSSAGYLKTFAGGQSDSDREKARAEITACKIEAKRIQGDVTRELCFTFITPFDREDIQDFSMELYKITKTIEKVCERLALYDGIGVKTDFSQQINLIVRKSEAMEGMVKALTTQENNKRVVVKAQELLDIEQQGDEVLSTLLANLFRETQDARELILRKDIYDMLEKVIDRYRNAANVALQIVLKHS